MQFAEPLIKVDNDEKIAFYLSNDDITKQNTILNMECGYVYKFYYLRKLQELNKLKDYLESIKRLNQ